MVNQIANVAWIASSIVGAYSGQFIPAGAFGMDYGWNRMFLCLLVFQLRGRLYVLTAIVAGVLAVFLALLVPGNSYIVLASVLAAFIGVVCRRKGIQMISCEYLLLVLGMGLVTYIPRWVPILFLSRRQLARWFASGWISYR